MRRWLALSSDDSPASVARRLGVNETTLRNWLADHLAEEARQVDDATSTTRVRPLRPGTWPARWAEPNNLELDHESRDPDLRCVVVVQLDDFVLPQVSGGSVFAQLVGHLRVTRASRAIVNGVDDRPSRQAVVARRG